MTFSFSRLNTYINCPKEWYMKYIEELDEKDNVYCQFGLLCHKLFEQYEKGEIPKDKVLKEYHKRFYNVVTDTEDEPTVARLFDSGYTYFKNYLFDLPLIPNGKILGIEQKCEFNVCEFSFVGYIDLLIEDDQKNIIIIDHKSADSPVGKKGNVLKNKQEKFIELKRQLYLYSKYIYETYGKFPSHLAWNHFKSGDWNIIPFDYGEYMETLDWARQTIKDILNDQTFQETPNYIYCSKLCSYRNGLCRNREVINVL